MKIAILTPTFSHYSGIDRVVEQQALRYAKSGDKVTIIAFEGDLRPKKFELCTIGMPKSLFLQRLYRLFFFIDRKKIRDTAEKLKGYEVIISHFYPMNWIASYAKRKYGIKYIYHNHGVGYSELFSNIFEKLYMKLFVFFNNLSLRNVDSAISISKFMQKELKRESGINSKVEYDQVDERKFRSGIDNQKVRKFFKIKNDEKLLLFVGRISPHKNIHTLIKILDRVNEKMPNVKLLVVGKVTFPNYYKHLKEIASKNVVFKDSVSDEDLPYYYAACDLYVTASLWEGFNLPIAEAQACGKKVVAFDVASHPEVVKKGVLVKKDDEEGFAQAVIRSLN